MGSYNARKRKVKKTVPTGQVHIQSTFNNTIITVTDLDGNVISWASAGTLKNQLHTLQEWLQKKQQKLLTIWE